MLEEMFETAAAYIGDLYLSNEALKMVVILVLGLILLILSAIAYFVK